MSARRQIPERRNGRNEAGFQLIETVIALGIVSVVMAGILDGLALTYRSATTTQNQVVATTILQGMIDDIRNSKWSTINGLVGSTLTSSSGQIVLVRTNGSQTGSLIHPRPLLCDCAAANYTPEAQTSLTVWNINTPNCAQVEETFTQSEPGVVRVDIAINWPGEAGGRRHLTAATCVSQYGIHNN